ncbi:MAG TPA: NAD(P)-dependent oxidoreductase, partial [Acidimicrobiales bacterium]|nr:NAD(P)-dependent oxidoreductase [Acidimicrobiales bacterium]
MTTHPDEHSATVAGAAVRAGFVGLGNIGEPMARNVAEAGFDLTVLDLNEAPMARLEAVGARRAASMTDLAIGRDVVLIVVINQAQVDKLLLDAPISGGPRAAADGTLSVMVGGDQAHLAIARPLLEAMGEHIAHVGGVGRGQITKIANNMVLAATMQTVHEALALCGAMDVDPQVMLEILSRGAADSWVARNWTGIGRSVSTYPGGVENLTALTLKDLTFGLELAARHDLTLPFTELTAGELTAP